MQNLDATIVSQYSDSPTLTQLAANLNAALGPEYNIEQLYFYIWNIDTAVGYGLDVWGRIVGVGRVITAAQGVFLGFEGPGGPSGDSFNVGIFYSGQPATQNFVLDDNTYRRVILAKAAANITNGSIQSINAILMNVLFPNRGNCYVKDNQNMSVTYIFTFTLTAVEVAIVSPAYGLLPTAGGISSSVVHP